METYHGISVTLWPGAEVDPVGNIRLLSEQYEQSDASDSVYYTARAKAGFAVAVIYGGKCACLVNSVLSTRHS